jgi:hypothetical protein
VKNPNRDDVAYLDELMRVFDKFRSKLADVNKSAAIWTELDEDTEIGDTDNQSG